MRLIRCGKPDLLMSELMFYLDNYVKTIKCPPSVKYQIDVSFLIIFFLNKITGFNRNPFQHSILGTIPSFYQYSKPVRTAAMRASYFLKTNGAAREDFYAFIRENSPCRQRFIDLLLGSYSTNLQIGDSIRSLVPPGWW